VCILHILEVGLFCSFVVNENILMRVVVCVLSFSWGGLGRSFFGWSFVAIFCCLRGV
jgi:hypothetical protein